MNRNVTAISGFGQVQNLAVQPSDASSTVSSPAVMPWWSYPVGALAGGLAAAFAYDVPVMSKMSTKAGRRVAGGILLGLGATWVIGRFRGEA